MRAQDVELHQRAERAQRVHFSRPALLRGKRGLVVAAVVLVAVVAVVMTLASTAGQPAAAVATAAPAPKLTARGVVHPAAEARIGALAGGVVDKLSAKVGQHVEEAQELARIKGPSGVEVLTAPWSGTVTNVTVNLGDTVMPGATLVVVGDLSQLRVITTDVDEFLIPHVHTGQVVLVSVDALDSRSFRGSVRSVALQPETTSLGDEQYPVVIDLSASTPPVIPGMTVRVDFASAGNEGPAD